MKSKFRKKYPQVSLFIHVLKGRAQTVQLFPSGAVLAYYFMLSVFPLLIIAGNILPYLDLDTSMVLPYIQEAVPNYIYSQLEPSIKSLFSESNTGLLSIASIGALWSASRGMNAMQFSMNSIYNVERRQNVVIARLFSMLVTIILIFGLAVLMIVFGFGQTILNYVTETFRLPGEISDIFQNYKWPVTMISLFLIFCLVYYVVPNVKLKLVTVFPGAVFSTVCWMAVSQAFAIYVRFFFSGPQRYAAFSTIILIMLWLQFSGVIITLGAILNATIELYRMKKQEHEGMGRRGNLS
ncbi:MAG: YihY/virulence factor BrkB family protein [Pisciglobus halotolerans]|nr:YihY/virulence factor BrkB family protein [Pisciglobus halotolerans]